MCKMLQALHPSSGKSAFASSRAQLLILSTEAISCGDKFSDSSEDRFRRLRKLRFIVGGEKDCTADESDETLLSKEFPCNYLANWI